MARILGIDPGSRITGYGLIESDAHEMRYLASGCIHTRQDDFISRLKIIFDSVGSVITDYEPDECAVESVFVATNPMGALKLGQARCAAIVAALTHNLPISEYEPRKVKKIIVGSGAAAKDQIEYMIKLLLKIEGELPADAADALAVAVCHARTHVESIR